jgi:hypothetical protein
MVSLEETGASNSRVCRNPVSDDPCTPMLILQGERDYQV